MRAVDGPRRARAFGHRLRAAVTERLAYKAAALFFAVVLWIVITTEQSTEQLVPVRFAPVLQDRTSLAAPPPAIQALIVGPTRELLKLYATPPTIRRSLDAGAADSARVELRPADVDLPPGVDAVVRGVQPQAVTLRLAPRVVSSAPR